MGYPLFVLLTIVCLARPEELFPWLAGIRMFLIVILLNLLVTGEQVLKLLSPGLTVRHPTVFGCLMLVFFVFFSQATMGRVGVGFDKAGEFAKVILYAILLILNVNTLDRLRHFMAVIVLLCLYNAILGMLGYYGLTSLEALAPVRQWVVDQETGELGFTYRLVGSGIYNDPNDLCLLMTFGTLACLYRVHTTAFKPAKLMWLSIILVYAWTVYLTQSRGGLLGAVAGLGTYLATRYGGKRAFPVMVILFLGLMTFGGRIGAIGLSRGDTAHERVMLWASGISYIMNAPFRLVFGIGSGEYSSEFYQVAHNTYIEMYVELGIFGGGMYLWIYRQLYASLRSLQVADPERTAPGIEVLPVLCGMLLGYAVGSFSVSRGYVISTYLVLGVVASYVSIMDEYLPETRDPRPFRILPYVLLCLFGLAALKIITQSLG